MQPQNLAPTITTVPLNQSTFSKASSLLQSGLAVAFRHKIKTAVVLSGLYATYKGYSFYRTFKDILPGQTDEQEQ